MDTVNDTLETKIAALLEAGRAPSTHSCYARDMEYVEAWHRLTFGAPLPWPAPTERVVRFVAEHLTALPAPVDDALCAAGLKRFAGPVRATTMRRRLAAWSAAHHARGLESPCRAPRVRELLRCGRRAEAPVRLTPALSETQLAAAVSRCDRSVAGVRDAALLQVAFWAGGRRRSELARLDVEDVQPAGPGRYWLTVRRGKRRHEPLVVAVRDEAATALGAWLSALGATSGPLFRRLFRGGRIGGRLSADGIAEILERRFAAAGLPAALSAHSVRAGYVSTAGQAGRPLGEVMAATGHRSLGSCLRYYRAGGTARSCA